jgi:ABC-2 type transport system permease protein
MSERLPPHRLPTLSGLLAGQLAYHTRVLVRAPRAVVGGVLLPVLLLVLRGHTGHLTAAEHAQLVAGLAAFGTLSTAYITHTSNLVTARQAGILKRWRATPLPAWCYFTGRIAATMLLAAGGGVVTALVGAADYHLQVHPGTILGLTLVLLLGAATWASIGTAASTVIPTVEAAWPLLGLTYLPMTILSGGFGSVGGEPTWLATIVAYLPVRPIIDGVSNSLTPGARGLPISAHGIAVLAVWGAVGMLLSGRWFQWAPRPPSRRRPARRAGLTHRRSA